MLHLVLSLDYELFGNGAGDVRSVVVEPTAKILEICDRHGVKVSIMFEMAEYLAIKDAAEAGQLDTPYDPARAMQEQVVGAVVRGHDVQLHIHPQWFGAVFRNGVWHLNMDQYRIADLPNGYGTLDDPLSILGAINISKKALEEMIGKQRPEYRCRVFRAGGFLIKPSQAVVRAMVETGIEVDSSVVKGLVRSAPFEVDFRHAEGHRNFWMADAADVGVRARGEGEVIECPVYSFRAPYVLNFMPAKLRAALKRRGRERKDRHCHVNSVQSTPGFLEVARKMFSSHVHTLDFCKLSAATMYKIVQKEMVSDPEGVLVFIGHSKDFDNERELDRFLGKVNKMDGVRISTFDEMVPLFIDCLGKR